MKEDKQRIMTDLQRKMSDDIARTIARNVDLADDPQVEMALTVQAAGTALLILADLIQIKGTGRRSKEPNLPAVLLAALLCARAGTLRQGKDLLELLALATDDLRALERAGVVGWLS
jgi:hypothetical protein